MFADFENYNPPLLSLLVSLIDLDTSIVNHSFMRSQNQHYQSAYLARATYLLKRSFLFLKKKNQSCSNPFSLSWSTYYHCLRLISTNLVQMAAKMSASPPPNSTPPSQKQKQNKVKPKSKPNRLLNKNLLIKKKQPKTSPSPCHTSLAFSPHLHLSRL